jgi:hypothetical protein
MAAEQTATTTFTVTVPTTPPIDSYRLTETAMA